MNLLFLGTGTSFGVPMIGCDCAVCRSTDRRDNRTRTSALLRIDEKNLLIDASTDFRQQALREGIRRIDAILLTHAHADHILGLDDVRAFSMTHQMSVPLYGAADTLGLIRRNLAYAFRVPHAGAHGWEVPRFTLSEIASAAEISGVTVMPVPINHGDSLIYGYRIGGLGYLTDCSAIPETSFELLQGLDTLVVGAIRREPHRHPRHFTVEQALELVARLRPRQAWVTHISHRLGHEATNATLPDNVRLAYDGLTVEIP